MDQKNNNMVLVCLVLLLCALLLIPYVIPLGSADLTQAVVGGSPNQTEVRVPSERALNRPERNLEAERRDARDDGKRRLDEIERMLD